MFGPSGWVGGFWARMSKQCLLLTKVRNRTLPSFRPAQRSILVPSRCFVMFYSCEPTMSSSGRSVSQCLLLTKFRIRTLPSFRPAQRSMLVSSRSFVMFYSCGPTMSSSGRSVNRVMGRGFGLRVNAGQGEYDVHWLGLSGKQELRHRGRGRTPPNMIPF